MHSKHYDVAVIGAGPAGLTTSLFIKHSEVIVIEEHEKPGIPKHCTGLVGEYTARFYIRLLGHDIIDNKYTGVFFHTPERIYPIYSKRILAYHIDRPLLEERLLYKVLDQGHEVVLSRRATPGKDPLLINIHDKRIMVDKVVAADGIHSIYRRRLLGVEAEYLVGVQRIYRVKNIIDTDVFHVVYNEYIPEFFQWLVPLSDKEVLVGYAKYPWRRMDPDTVFKHIVKRVGVETNKVIETFGGLIPLNKPLKNPVYMNKVFFIGDSSFTSKPYTGGGLYGIALLVDKLGEAITRNNPGIYTRAYNEFRKRLILEHIVSSMLRYMKKYWLPAEILWILVENGLDPNIYYDNHTWLIIEALKKTPRILSAYLINTIND